MSPETWMAMPSWVDASLKALVAFLDQHEQASVDLHKVTRDVLVEKYHGGVNTALDLPSQESALRTLISAQLRKDFPVDARLADDKFLAEVDIRVVGPITDQERAEYTYMSFLVQRLSPAQIANSIKTLVSKTAA